MSLALVLSSGPATARPVHLNLDAWSVNTTSQGTVDVAVRELDHPAELRQALAEAGVPALVLFGKLCDSPAAVSRAVHVLGGSRSGEVVLTIHPAEIPAGAEVLFSLKEGQVNPPYHGTLLTGIIGVIWKGSHLICPPQVRSGGTSTVG